MSDIKLCILQEPVRYLLEEEIETVGMFGQSVNEHIGRLPQDQQFALSIVIEKDNIALLCHFTL